MARSRRLTTVFLNLANCLYAKERVTFADALTVVRRALRAEAALRTSQQGRNLVEVPPLLLERLTALARYVA